MMTMQLLAEVAAKAEPMIPGNWLTAFVVAVIGAGAAAWARMSGRKQGAKEARAVILQSPVPTIRTQEEPEYVTNDTLNRHLERIDGSIREIKHAQDSERGVARDALGKIHMRLDVQSKVTATLQGSVEEVGKNVGRLLDLALQRKPTTRG